MERVNGRIVVAVLVIMAAGAYRVLVIKSPGATAPSGASGVTITRVIVAGYLLGIVAAIIDLIGGPVSAVAGLMLALAVVTALYTVIPDLFSRITARSK